MSYHNFHIPVMGIGFTADTAIKVAHYGISSVISLVDDSLLEKLREYYCRQMNIPFSAVGSDIVDHRAKRITLYLNLIDDIAAKNFSELQASPFENGSGITRYFEMLPDDSTLRHAYTQMLRAEDDKTRVKLQSWLRENITAGSIDVNIMTKLDKVNFAGKQELSYEYNDACAALRGFALSKLSSSIVLSAGINIRLYSYMASFEDFYPDEKRNFKKKIIIKVSDYRSALTQGKFLAKKGLWVSEYRIESGLNCGGHLFATQGYLAGPILEEFKNHRDDLIGSMYELFTNALKSKDKPVPDSPPDLKITYQGGICTTREHMFLLNYYKVNSTGWGSPFLLVPEITNIDDTTLALLCKAEEDDLYLSDISPLGVPFNTVKGNTKDEEKQINIQKGTPGSRCPKNYLIANTEFTKRAICTASRAYQRRKIKELDEQSLEPKDYTALYNKIIEKSCICVGLGTSALLVNNLDTTVEGNGVSVCPGPNLAYFSKVVSLQEMVDHIYGRTNILNEKNRPNMFIKEIEMYVDYLKTKVDESLKPLQEKQLEYFTTFRSNLYDGIRYYKNLFSTVIEESIGVKEALIAELELFENELACIQL